MGMTLEEFLKKYPKPKQCPIPDDVWSDGLSYCWGYALTIDDGKKWDDSKCPCDFFEGAKNTEQLLQPDSDQ